MTESPDETAQGEWLDLVTKAGFSYLMASVRYLRDGERGAAHRRGRAARRGDAHAPACQAAQARQGPGADPHHAAMSCLRAPTGQALPAEVAPPRPACPPKRASATGLPAEARQREGGTICCSTVLHGCR